MNFFSPGDQDLQNILGGMSQQQFMQLIGEKPSRIIFSLINLILSLLFDYFYMILLLIINLMRCHCLSMFEHVFVPVGGIGMGGPGGGLSALMGGRPSSAQSTASEP